VCRFAELDDLVTDVVDDLRFDRISAAAMVLLGVMTL
jgi:hypothetical protein